MKTRPFGNVAWGAGITLMSALIFAAGTLFLLSTSPGPGERDTAGPVRVARIANGLSSVAQPAMTMGRFLASGQAEDMRAYMNAMQTLQTNVRAVSGAYAGATSTADQLSQLDQQINRAMSLGQQALAQPGAALLNAGAPGSVEQIGTAALANVKSQLDAMLSREIEKTPLPVVEQAGSKSPALNIWIGTWATYFGVLGVLVLMTALRSDETQNAPVAQPFDRPVALNRPKSAEQNGGNLANVARQLELAHLDSLTGLLNKKAIASTVEKAIEWSLRKGATIGMIYVEIDGFKALRQELGQNVANALIVEVGKQLKETFRRGDQVARLRDGEFAVVVSEISGREILTRVEERVHEAIADLRLPGTGNRKIKVNIGLAMYPIDGYSDEDLLASAQNVVLYGTGQAPLAIIEAPRAIVAAKTPFAPVASVPQPAPTKSPPPSAEAPPALVASTEPPPETVEHQVDTSLAELHLLIGKYLEAEHGSAEKHAQAQLLVGEFKRRG